MFKGNMEDFRFFSQRKRLFYEESHSVSILFKKESQNREIMVCTTRMKNLSSVVQRQTVCSTKSPFFSVVVHVTKLKKDLLYTWRNYGELVVQAKKGLNVTPLSHLIVSKHWVLGVYFNSRAR